MNKKGQPRPRKWTDEENEYIRKHYPRVDAFDLASFREKLIEMADHLGRSERAIRERASVLGVTDSERGPVKSTKDGMVLYPGEAEEIRAMWPRHDFYTIARWIGCHPNAVARVIGELHDDRAGRRAV